MAEGLVLIVDDDDNIRELYASAFEMADFTVLQAKDGAEAIKLALEQHPSVILMDVTMPGLNGHEAVKKIRLDEWGKHARIIYLTNLTDPENIINAVKQQCDEYIVKANTDVHDIVKRARMVMYSVKKEI